MKSSASSFSKFKSGSRKTVRLSSQSLVKTGHLVDDQKLPLLIEPNAENVNLSEWAASHRDFIQEKLDDHGGILFRGFGVKTVEEFEGFIANASSPALKYSERSSPRSQVEGNIYTSTDYPPNESIFLHNEQSYNLTFPTKILFFCMQAAPQGGETPIADSRRVYERLDPQIRSRFAEKGYMYVRNFGGGAGLSWPEVFQTSDPKAVEEYCKKQRIEFEWRDEGKTLRTRQVRRAIARHPRTGVPTWFNHLTFFHVSTLSPAIRETMMESFAEDELPNNTYYGDGTSIEPEILDTLREIYSDETVTFSWQEGDVLMLDNMTVAHSRNPFSGPRKVVVGMADPMHWDDVLPGAEEAS